MENAIFNKLASVAQGMDEYGRPVSRQEQLAAYEKLTEMRTRRENQRLAELKMSNERSVEAEKIAAQRELEHRRLDMEEERLKIQKAEVVVKALEVAAQGGADAAALLDAVRGLSLAMLPESTATTLLLERREKT
jgi:predicted PP-loop superfamily ATPase